MLQTQTFSSTFDTHIRANELESIRHFIEYGDHCCALVAPSNAGKSAVLRTILKTMTEGPAAHGDAPTVGVFIDCLAVGGNEAAFYELILRRIVEELQFADVKTPGIDDLDLLRREAFGIADPAAARAWFESNIRRLLRTTQSTFVVTLDEFDNAYQSLPPEPLNEMVVLKEEFPAQLRYVIGTSRFMKRLRSDFETYEFRELFHLSTHVLRPLDRSDARRLVSHLAQQYGLPDDDLYATATIALSGGHPGLLERTYRLLASTDGYDPKQSLESVASRLLRKEPILKECQRLWSELEEEEQEQLLDFVTGYTPGSGEERFAAAMAKGLIVPQGAEVAIFGHLFHSFVKTEWSREEEAVTRGIYCNIEAERIWIDEQDITYKLSSTQRHLLFALYEKDGRTCTYEEIAERIHGSKEGVTNKSIQMLVRRLRDQFPSCTEYIEAVSGEGYRLVNLDSE